MTTETEILYSRWHTPRTVAANTLDTLAGLADLILSGVGLLFAALAVLAYTGHSGEFGRGQALGLALLALAAFGAGRATCLLLGEPAEWLRPGYGHLPGWAVPVRVRSRVREYVTDYGPAPVSEIAMYLDLPRSTVISALRRLADEGRAVKIRRTWDVPERRQTADGPQVPVLGGEDR